MGELLLLNADPKLDCKNNMKMIEFLFKRPLKTGQIMSCRPFFHLYVH